MRLPNAERAIIPAAKLREYLLSLDHPKGAHKAIVFAAAGYRRDNWWRLRNDLKQLVRQHTAAELIVTAYGRKFLVRGTLQGPQGSLAVVTMWILLHHEPFPRFVTAYPERTR